MATGVCCNDLFGQDRLLGTAATLAPTQAANPKLLAPAE
jgi:hypothetical protein